MWNRGRRPRGRKRRSWVCVGGGGGREEAGQRHPDANERGCEVKGIWGVPKRKIAPSCARDLIFERKTNADASSVN